MSPVSYFTAVLVTDGTAWRTRDVDVQDAASLDDLADTLSTLGYDDRPVLAVIEHEDEWFALVRVDGDDDPRLFVSDLVAASRGTFGDVLASAADLDGPGVPDARNGHAAPDPGDDAPARPGDPVLDGLADGDDVTVDGIDLGDLDDREPAPPPPWAGNTDLLADLGVPVAVLLQVCDEHPDDPASALAELGELAGFADLLEALR